MTVILKCPHCGRMESWREADGARTHCTFCKQPLTGSVQVSQAAQSHSDRPRTSEVLRHTLWGGVIGGGLALGITLVYQGIPLLLALIVLTQDIRPDQRTLLQEVVQSQGLMFVVVGVVGGALGALVMAVTGAALHARPALLRAAGVGAILGGLTPPAAVFLAMTIPEVMVRGLEDAGMPAMFAQHWLLSLALAVPGAILGLMACAALAARRETAPSGG